MIQFAFFWSQVAITALCQQLIRYSSNDYYTLEEPLP